MTGICASHALPARAHARVFSLVSGLYRLRDLQAREARARKVRPTPEKEADRKTELKGVLSSVSPRVVHVD